MKNKYEKILSFLLNWLVIAIVFLLPLSFSFFRENYYIFVISKSLIFKSAVSLLLILWLIKFYFNQKINQQKDKWIYYSLLFLVGSWVISVFLSILPKVSFWGLYTRQQGVFSLLFYAAFFLILILDLKDIKQFKRIIMAGILSSVVVVFYGLIQYFGLDPITWNENSTRIFSTLGQPNFFGHYLVIVLPLTLYGVLYIARRFWQRFLLFILLSAQIFCLIFTYSRAAWLAIVASSTVGALVFAWHKGYRKKILILLATLVVVFVVVMQSSIIKQPDSTNFSVMNRVTSMFNWQSETIRIRIFYWQSAINYFKESDWQRKIFGYGKETQGQFYAKAYQPEWGIYESPNTYPDRAHNLFIDLWLEMGLLGLSATVFFVLLIIIRAVKYLLNSASDPVIKKSIFFILLSLLAYFINNLFSFSLTTHYAFLYLLLALLWWLSGPKMVVKVDTPLLSTKSLKILVLSAIIFVIFIFYNFSLMYYVADKHYLKAKKAYIDGNCETVFEEMNKTLDIYPASAYYQKEYLFLNNNCFVKLRSEKKDFLYVVAGIIDQLDRLGNNFYKVNILKEVARSYSLFGRYLDPKYYDSANEIYLLLLDLSPNDVNIYQDFGRMKMWSSDFDGAIAVYNQGVAKTPPIDSVYGSKAQKIKAENGLLRLYELIGDVYFSKKNYDEALRYYEIVLQKRSIYIPIYKKMADLYYLKNNLELAIDYNLRAGNMEPNNTTWWLGLSQLYSELGNRQKTLEYARKVLDLDPDNKQALIIVGN